LLHLETRQELGSTGGADRLAVFAGQVYRLVSVERSSYPIIELKLKISEENPSEGSGAWTIVENRLAEPMGTKEKFWCVENGNRHLFKFVREGTGEDWSEKAVTEIARALQMPCAHAEMAALDGRPGILVGDFLDRMHEGLVHGNELLVSMKPTYPHTASYGVREHTIENVLAALDDFQVSTPRGAPSGIANGGAPSSAILCLTR
jgi:hypothetical protein